ncbi:MAG: hypothetical protein ACJZ8W_00365 [Limisphaerales bacterium]|jgi:hypothetical protein
MKQLIKTTLIRTLWVAPLLAAGLAIGCAQGEGEQSTDDAAAEEAAEPSDTASGEGQEGYPDQGAPEGTEGSE